MTAAHVHGLMADLLVFRKASQEKGPKSDFEKRCDAFAHELQALTLRYGVAVTSTAALGAWNQIEMIDCANYPRGVYLRDRSDLEWVRGDDENPMPYGDRVDRHGARRAEGTDR